MKEFVSKYPPIAYENINWDCRQDLLQKAQVIHPFKTSPDDGLLAIACFWKVNYENTLEIQISRHHYHGMQCHPTSFVHPSIYRRIFHITLWTIGSRGDLKHTAYFLNVNCLQNQSPQSDVWWKLTILYRRIHSSSKDEEWTAWMTPRLFEMLSSTLQADFVPRIMHTSQSRTQEEDSSLHLGTCLGKEDTSAFIFLPTGRRVQS